MLKREAPDHQHKMLYQLRIVTRIFALVVILLLIVGYFLPRSYHIERSVVIDVPMSSVEDYLSEASNLTTWMYVQKGQIEDADVVLHKDLELTINYESGEEGNIKIGDLSSSVFHFAVVPKNGQRAVSNEIQLESVEAREKTRISWSIKGELEAGLLSPYLALFANDIAGANFEKSLSLLKVELEG